MLVHGEGDYFDVFLVSVWPREMTPSLFALGTYMYIYKASKAG